MQGWQTSLRLSAINARNVLKRPITCLWCCWNSKNGDLELVAFFKWKFFAAINIVC
jgi:hypothetical protein